MSTEVASSAANSKPAKKASNADPTTMSGVPIKRLYTPADVGKIDFVNDIGEPGSPPFTRGMHENMYRGRVWTMRQFAGMGSAAQTNERFKYLLEHGQTGLSTAFDLPTLMGRDSDDALALGEVGKCGVAIASLEDMKILFDGIDLGQVSTSMTINAPAAILLAFYICVAKEQGVPPEKLRGTLQNDILKEFHAQNEFIYPPEASGEARRRHHRVLHEAQSVPRWNSVSISGYHIREAGSSRLVQELAFTLARRHGVTWSESPEARAGCGLLRPPAQLLLQRPTTSSSKKSAKLRAARRIWCRRR